LPAARSDQRAAKAGGWLPALRDNRDLPPG
jgi:hypothetical protein